MTQTAKRLQDQVESSASDEAAQTARPTSSQRVQMSRAELDLYVKEGRPTGLLLSSVALLKGMDADDVSKASGIPVALVRSILGGHAIGAIKNGTIKRVASILGIDLSSMRFAAGQVHVFDLSRAPRFCSAERLREHVRAIGLLARGARVAELKVPTGLVDRVSGRKMFVAQSESFRGLFLSSGLARFNIEHIPAAQWARARREDSVVTIDNSELVGNLRARDLTEGEFDELFMGADAFTWDDIRVASRVNGVSKADVMEFIRSRAAELDASDDIEAKRLVNEARPAFLRLVDTESKVAVG